MSPSSPQPICSTLTSSCGWVALSWFRNRQWWWTSQPLYIRPLLVSFPYLISPLLFPFRTLFLLSTRFLPEPFILLLSFPFLTLQYISWFPFLYFSSALLFSFHHPSLFSFPLLSYTPFPVFISPLLPFSSHLFISSFPSLSLFLLTLPCFLSLPSASFLYSSLLYVLFLPPTSRLISFLPSAELQLFLKQTQTLSLKWELILILNQSSPLLSCLQELLNIWTNQIQSGAPLQTGLFFFWFYCCLFLRPHSFSLSLCSF